MSDKKWDRGPWFAVPSCEHDGVDCFWIQCDDLYIVGSVDGPQSNLIRQASANLMASAPDLYEALENLLDAYCSHMSSEYDFPDSPWSPERDKDQDALDAIAALSKARGES